MGYRYDVSIHKEDVNSSTADNFLGRFRTTRIASNQMGTGATNDPLKVLHSIEVHKILGIVIPEGHSIIHNFRSRVGIDNDNRIVITVSPDEMKTERWSSPSQPGDLDYPYGVRQNEWTHQAKPDLMTVFFYDCKLFKFEPMKDIGYIAGFKLTGRIEHAPRGH